MRAEEFNFSMTQLVLFIDAQLKVERIGTDVVEERRMMKTIRLYPGVRMEANMEGWEGEWRRWGHAGREVRAASFLSNAQRAGF
jgi:hypothetical protein